MAIGHAYSMAIGQQNRTTADSILKSVFLVTLNVPTCTVFPGPVILCVFNA